MYFNHPLVKENKIERREYQIEAALRALSRNTLVVLPTGTGKTVIALLATIHWIEKHPDSKVIFTAPTKPLITQHEKTFKDLLKLNEKEMTVLSGELSPFQRKYLWNRRIIFATPQVIYNDIIRGFIKPEDNWMLIFDEAHRAMGNYAYVKIVEYIKTTGKTPRILALTASPGEKEKVNSIMKNLDIEDIYILTEKDQKISKYFYGYSIRQYFLEGDILFYYIIETLKRYLYRKIEEFNRLLTNPNLKLMKNRISYTYIDDERKKLDELYLNGEIEKLVWRRLKGILYQILIVDRLLSYVESYSYRLAFQYLMKITAKSSRKGGILEKEVVNSQEINEARLLLNKFNEKNTAHPKLEKLTEILKNEKYEKVIVFVSIKQVAIEIKEKLSKEGIESDILVGQKRKNNIGLTQRKQIGVLYRFRSGKFKVLIATHIGEEGLDIGEVDLVVFYDNPISAIRRIQRMGRTGRKRKGRIYFLITRKTREEMRYWAGLMKERKLYTALKELATTKGYIANAKIDEYIEKHEEKELNETIIYIDFREKAADIINFLKKKGIKIEIRALEVGDYQIGEYIIERKTMKDFMDSIIDGRIFKQAKKLKDIEGGKPLIIIEGDIKDFISRGDISIYSGAVLSLLLDYNLKIYISSGPRETSELIFSLYKRESAEKKKTVKLRISKKPYEINEIQKYVLAGIPGIDNKLAERLLLYFKNIKNIADASPTELMRVKGIGVDLAERIYKIFRHEYHSSSLSNSK